MKSKTFKFIGTAGHGYLVVANAIMKQYINELIDNDKLSDISYSYWQRKNCYLEEDCEAHKFLAWYEKDTGVKPKIKETYQDNINKNRPISWVIGLDQKDGSHWIL